MADKKQNQQTPPTPQKSKPTVWHVIAVALVGIFLVLTLSNLDAILSPLDTLFSILAPITVGLVLAYILHFFLRFFEYKIFRGIRKRSLNRALSMFSSYILLLAIIAGMLFLIIPSVMESFSELQTKGGDFIDELIDSIDAIISSLVVKFPVLGSLFGTNDTDRFVNLEELLKYALNLLSTSGSWIISNIVSIAGSTITVLKNILVGLFISVYVLLSKERLSAGCRRVCRALLSKKNEERVLGYFARAHSKFGGYIIGKLVDSTMVMLVCMLLFTFFNIPYPILIAAIIGVTDIIPFFGPFLGAIPSALIIFIIDPWKAIVFVLLILVVQQIDGNFIAPLILGDRTGLSSLGVIVAVTVMGGIFGIPGMLIGVPLFALIMSILDDIITSRLKAKGEPTSLKKYYPADAFIRPQDEEDDDATMLKRFSHWVASVETEKPGEDYTPGFWHSVGRGLRKFFLAIGRFFHRLFSIKPIPEDQKSSIYTRICTKGIPTKHSFWRTLLLAIPTLCLYPLYVVEVVSQGINIACRKDGKRTWGALPVLVFTIITLGIFPIVWHCKIINRMKEYCEKHGIACKASKRFYLCWGLIGFPILVGPLIASAHFLRAFREIAASFNQSHTFPLSSEMLSADIPEQVEEPRPRKSIIEQILDPDEEPLDEEDDDDEDDNTILN